MTSPFWNFSLAFYRLPEVAPACLRCQDEAGADVSLLLFVLWRASTGVLVEAAEVARLDAAVGPWRRQVVEPLRRVRREMKDMEASLDASNSLRQRVKGVELEAERLEQEALFRAAGDAASGAPSPGAAKANLAAYAAATGSRLPSAAVGALLDAFGTLH